jgi:hypothetical protein
MSSVRPAAARSISMALHKVGKGVSGDKIRKVFYRAALIKTLYSLGGRDLCREVRKAMEQSIMSSFPASEHEFQQNCVTPRWWNAVQWCRWHLTNEGLMRNDSERGIWELTNAGVEAAEALIGPATTRNERTQAP